MTERRGEKIGWTGGWLGGFIWLALLAVVFMFQGQWLEGIIGMALTGLAVLVIVFGAPWRHPATPYWKLMLAPYAVFFISVAWAFWAFGSQGDLGLSWWHLFWFVPMLIPLGTVGRRTWTDFEQ